MLVRSGEYIKIYWRSKPPKFQRLV